MKKEFAISVIVPVYNVEPYLHRCIDSILSQTFKDFELILVDDGATDHSSAICDEYAAMDSRITVLHIPNGGVSHARNVGLNVVRGQYVTFVDSDDYVDSRYLETLFSAAQRNDADLVRSGYIAVDQCDNPLYQFVTKLYSIPLPSMQERTHYLINHVLYRNNGWESWSSLFKSDLIQKHYIRFCETCENFAEDMGFMLEYLLYCKKAASVQETLYYYVQHKNSMMAKSRDCVRLNPLNEVAMQFGKRFFTITKRQKHKRYYSLLYYLIMSNQYRKMNLRGENRKQALTVNQAIHNIKWHDKWMRRVTSCRNELITLYGKKEATEIILTARLLANRNWKQFTIEKRLSKKVLSGR